MTADRTYMHRKPPEEALAELVNDHMGTVIIAPSEVKAILTAKWHRIIVLAHAIHDSADDGWPKFTPKPDPYAPANSKPEEAAAYNALRARAHDDWRRAQSGPHPC